MNLLVDTQILLWYLRGDPQLSQSSLDLVQSTENNVWVSMASLWEIAIKDSLGKLSLGLSISDFVDRHVTGNGFEILTIEPSHLSLVQTLPWHHKDPFDRLIIAQAMIQDLSLVSSDRHFMNYPVSLIVN